MSCQVKNPFLAHELKWFSLVFFIAGDWKAVNEELTVSCRYVIKNQTTGDRLNIRVVAVNAGGRSPPATLPDAILVREVVGKFRFPCQEIIPLSHWKEIQV